MASFHLSNKRLGLAQIHFAMFLAAAAGLFAKILPLSPGVITCGRTAFGTLALALAAAGVRSNLRLSNWKDFFMLFLSGAILGLHWLTFVWAVQVSTVAVALLAFSSFPLFATFLEPLFFDERLHYYDVITALVVIAGLALLTPAFDLKNGLTQGVIWGVVSALTYALLSLLSRFSVRSYPSITIAFYQQGFAALCTLPFALQWKGAIALGDLLLLAILGVIFTALVHGLVVASLRHLRVQTVSIISCLEPVYGIALACLLLRENPPAKALLGGALIGAAILWDLLKHVRTGPPANPG